MSELGLLFSLLTNGIVLGMIPALIYGRIGGDEKFKNDNPIFVKFLHYFHHWMIGYFIVILATVSLFLGMCTDYMGIFFLGFGASMYLDDAYFHSFSQYFVRKKPNGEPQK